MPTLSRYSRLDTFALKAVKHGTRSPLKNSKILKNLPDPQQTQMDLIKGYVASFITRLKPKRAQKKHRTTHLELGVFLDV